MPVTVGQAVEKAVPVSFRAIGHVEPIEQVALGVAQRFLGRQERLVVGDGLPCHDTPPLLAVLDRWQGTDEWGRRAAYLADRLSVDAVDRAVLESRLIQDRAAMLTALFADLFRGPARNVLIFWTDLFGVREVYNRPGVVDGTNWTLRVPPNYARFYRDACARGEAPDLALALAWALRARRLDQDAEGQGLSTLLRSR
mgnify:CR=1 FL=1